MTYDHRSNEESEVGLGLSEHRKIVSKKNSDREFLSA